MLCYTDSEDGKNFAKGNIGSIQKIKFKSPCSATRGTRCSYQVPQQEFTLSFVAYLYSTAVRKIILLPVSPPKVGFFQLQNFWSSAADANWRRKITPVWPGPRQYGDAILLATPDRRRLLCPVWTVPLQLGDASSASPEFPGVEILASTAVVVCVA